MNIKQEIKDLQQRLSVLESQLLDEPEYDWDNSPIITTIDGFEYRLGPHADKVMTWDDAVKWCQSVGGELPSREVLLMCYLNADIKPKFAANCYAASDEFSCTRSEEHTSELQSH